MYKDILITQLNDFVFCPASVYFHMLYGDTERVLYQSEKQLNGTKAHETIDMHKYTSKNIITGLDVYCEEFSLVGKIDMYDVQKQMLIERKRMVKQIYDGYIYQVYAQCLAMREMGYPVKKIKIHNIVDNKDFDISLPENNPEMYQKFVKNIEEIKNFKLKEFVQDNKTKCLNCIYESACDRTLV